MSSEGRGGHTFYVCDGDHDETHCQFCDGGLAVCTTCNGGEGALTSECCGQSLADSTLERVHLHGLDFKDGEWNRPEEVVLA